MIDHPRFSVVIPSCNEGEMLHMTVDSILNSTKYTGGYEIIIVDDGSTDGSCDKYQNAEDERRIKVISTDHIGVARARNAGFAIASGKYVVFLDAHCKVSDNWLSRFEQDLEDPRVAILGPTFTQLNQPYPKGCGMMWTSELVRDTVWYEPIPSDSAYIIPLTPGGCQAFRSDTFEKLGMYDEGFARWGSEDLELCYRAWSLGYTVKVDPQIEIQHYFRQDRNFTVDLEDVAYNYLRMVYFHFSSDRLDKITGEMMKHDDYPTLVSRIEKSDVFELRDEISKVRKYDDNWFFSTFG